MKKHTILFAILMVTSILNAQLKVNSSGNTEIGSNITTSGKFNVKGNSYLEGRTELSGGNIIINGTTAQSGPALHLLASNGYPGMFLSATSSFNCSYILGKTRNSQTKMYCTRTFLIPFRRTHPSATI